MSSMTDKEILEASIKLLPFLRYMIDNYSDPEIMYSALLTCRRRFVDKSNTRLALCSAIGLKEPDSALIYCYAMNMVKQQMVEDIE